MTLPDPIPPTQVRHPWRTTARTVAAAVLALLLILPSIMEVLGLSALPWAAAVLAVVGGVTRVLAMPRVETWMLDYLPWLSAEPRQP